MTTEAKLEQQRLLTQAHTDPVFVRGKHTVGWFIGIAFFFLCTFYLFMIFVCLLYSYKPLSSPHYLGIAAVLIAAAFSYCIFAGENRLIVAAPLYACYIIYHLCSTYIDFFAPAGIMSNIIRLWQFLIILLLFAQIALWFLPSAKVYFAKMREIHRTVAAQEKEMGK